MSLIGRLAQQLIAEHPQDAARVLERLPDSELIETMIATPREHAAELISALSPSRAQAVIDGTAVEWLTLLLEPLTIHERARLLRRAADQRQEGVLARMDPGPAASVARLLRFPENSAGAWMDPDVLALPVSMRAEEAWERVRQAAEHARYNVYALDGAKLVGVFTLRELMLAPPDAEIASFMVHQPFRVDAHADRLDVLAHPGWRRVSSMPVVDAEGHYLGAIRYLTVREMEASLQPARHGADADAAEALGRLVALAGRSLLESLGGVSAHQGEAR